MYRIRRQFYLNALHSGVHLPGEIEPKGELPMNFKEAVQAGFQNYVNFKGRAARSEYWWWTLFSFLASLSAAIIDTVIFPGTLVGEGPIYIVTALALLLPSLGLMFRRIHDLEKSAWWLLLMLVPLVNLIMLIWFCKKGTDGNNRFGPDPLSFYTPSRDNQVL
jgi:uncharacterized membrane protein YhaH (DUF805 family)